MVCRLEGMWQRHTCCILWWCHYAICRCHSPRVCGVVVLRTRTLGCAAYDRSRAQGGAKRTDGHIFCFSLEGHLDPHTPQPLSSPSPLPARPTPTDGNHDVRIFDALPEGGFTDNTRFPPPRPSCDRGVTFYRGLVGLQVRGRRALSWWEIPLVAGVCSRGLSAVARCLSSIVLSLELEEVCSTYTGGETPPPSSPGGGHSIR